MKHDSLCPLVKLSVLKSGCPQCDLIRRGRIDGVRMAVEAVDKGGRAEKQMLALLAEVESA